MGKRRHCVERAKPARPFGLYHANNFVINKNLNLWRKSPYTSALVARTCYSWQVGSTKFSRVRTTFTPFSSFVTCKPNIKHVWYFVCMSRMLLAHKETLSIQLVTNNKYARLVRSCAAGLTGIAWLKLSGWLRHWNYLLQSILSLFPCTLTGFKWEL